MKKFIVLFSFLANFVTGSYLYSQELPKANIENSFYMLPIFEDMRKQGMLTYDEKNEQMIKMKDQLGEGNLYHSLGFSMIYSPSYPEVPDICYLSQKNGIHLGFIFDFQSHTRDDYSNVAMDDLRLFQWRMDGKTWEGELTSDRRGYRVPTPSRLAEKLIDFNNEKVKDWAESILDLMKKYPGVITIVNGPIEEELAGGSEHEISKIGDYSPYAITEFRDWLRHTGIYDDESGKYAGEGAGSSIIGDLIDFNGIMRSQFYDDPSPAENNGTGKSFNDFFGVYFNSWTLKYWDLEMFPGAITDTSFDLTPSFGKGYYQGGFDAPRVPNMKNPFWRAWSYEMSESGDYPPGNPENPSYGFRQVLVKHYVSDLFNLMESYGIPVEMMYPHQIPAEILHDPERELTAASPTWTGFYEKAGHVGITRFGRLNTEIVTQYADDWGIFEWHTQPNADPQSDEFYNVSINDLNLFYENSCKTLWPGWWEISPPGEGTTFPLNDSKFADAIYDFMQAKAEVPYFLQNTDEQDYIPPVIKNINAVFYESGKLKINWNQFIWEDLSSRWQDWKGFDHFEVQWSTDQNNWNSTITSDNNIELPVDDNQYYVRARAVSKSEKKGSWSEIVNSINKTGQTPWIFTADYDSLKAYKGLLNLITIKNVGNDIDSSGMNVEMSGNGKIQNTIPLNRDELEMFWSMKYSNEIKTPNGLENKKTKGGIFSAITSAKQPVDPHFFLPVNTFSGLQYPYISLRVYSEKSIKGELHWFYNGTNSKYEFDLNPGWQVISIKNLPEWTSVAAIEMVRIDFGDIPLNHVMVDWVSISSTEASQELKPEIMVWQKHIIEIMTSPVDDPGFYTLKLSYNQMSDSIKIKTYPDNILPVVNITMPGKDTLVEAGKELLLKVNVSKKDSEISYIDFFENSTFFSRIFEEPYELSVTIPNEENDYALYVKAFDNSGTSGTSDTVNIKAIKQKPFNNETHYIPGIIEAENYDEGGNNISYFDSDTINKGGEYRSDYVDIGKINDTYYVGWTNPGEWLEYTISCDTTMKAEFIFNIAYENKDGEIHLEIDEKRITQNLFIKNTGGNLEFKEINFKDIILPEGVHKLRLFFDRGHPNVDKFEIKKFKLIKELPVSEGNIIVYPNPADDYIRFMFGIAKEREVSIFDINGKLILTKNLPPKKRYIMNVNNLRTGVYLIRIKSNNSILNGKFVKY